MATHEEHNGTEHSLTGSGKDTVVRKSYKLADLASRYEVKRKRHPMNVHFHCLTVYSFRFTEQFRPSNTYATRKTIAQGLLDFALLMANAAQLKSLLDFKSVNQYYYPLLVLISLSILLQLATGIVLLVLGMMNPKTETGKRNAEILNNTAVILILLITVINIFISAFGITFTSQ